MGSAHTMSRAGQLTHFFVVKQAKNLLYGRISLRKVSRSTKIKEKSRSGCSRCQTCDVLQSDWPVNICSRGSKTVWAILPPRVYPERTKRYGGSCLVSRLLGILKLFFTCGVTIATGWSSQHDHDRGHGCHCVHLSHLPFF